MSVKSSSGRESRTVYINSELGMFALTEKRGSRPKDKVTVIEECGLVWMIE